MLADPNAVPSVTTVLLLLAPDPRAPDLAADLRAAGFLLCAQGDAAHLVRETLRHAPDLLVLWTPHPDAQLLQAIATLQAQQAVPVLAFTQDGSVETMQRALEAGVHAWVVQGYAPARLRPLVHLALARAAHETALRARVAQLGDRLEERKWVDKAKGILMRSSAISEDDAFQLLRTASMQGNQRVGQVSRQVIAVAGAADAINRAGQQRMLSQRLVKLYALACSGSEGRAAGVLMRASIERVDANLAALEAELSAPTYGDLIAAAATGWQALRRALQGEPRASELQRLDALAETVLQQAQALVGALEASGSGAQAGVINVSGRQRMLSQRVAKLALLRAAGVQGTFVEELAATATAFDAGLQALNTAPLSTPEIRAMLEHGGLAWQELRGAVPAADQPAGRLRIAAASEELLEVFDRLTEAYQHSIQVLMGA